jgi:hypothetical protein
MASGGGMSLGAVSITNGIVKDNTSPIKGTHLSPFLITLSSRSILMLSLLLLYAITRSSFGEAAPMPSIERRDLSGCGELIETRTLWNIIWSCLSTIFFCTWGSLHPNISSTPDEPGMGWWDKLRKWLLDLLMYKLPLFLWALLVPEYILAWAIRQYIVAGEIQKKGAIFILCR